MKLRSLVSIASIAASSIVASGAFAPAQAVGVLLTSEVGYTGPALDLTNYAVGGFNYTFGPKAIPGGITFTSNAIGTFSPLGSVLGRGYYELGDGPFDPNGNGYLGFQAVYAALDAPSGYMTFSFATPVKSFGAFLTYVPNFGDNPVISTYDSNNNLLSSFDLSVLAPISSPGEVNHFEFRGITEDTASIANFRLSGAYIVAAGSVTGAVPPQGTAIPEPLTIVGTLVGGSAALRLRKKLKPSRKTK